MIRLIYGGEVSSWTDGGAKLYITCPRTLPWISHHAGTDECRTTLPSLSCACRLYRIYAYDKPAEADEATLLEAQRTRLRKTFGPDVHISAPPPPLPTPPPPALRPPATRPKHARQPKGRAAPEEQIVWCSECGRKMAVGECDLCERCMAVLEVDLTDLKEHQLRRRQGGRRLDCYEFMMTTR